MLRAVRRQVPARVHVSGRRTCACAHHGCIAHRENLTLVCPHAQAGGYVPGDGGRRAHRRRTQDGPAEDGGFAEDPRLDALGGAPAEAQPHRRRRDASHAGGLG